MQTVEHGLHNMHKMFDDIDSLFAYTSVKEHGQNLIKPVFNSVFRDTINTFDRWGYTDYKVDYRDVKYKKLDAPKNEHKVILCFSGGKDSTATAIWFIEHGYDVILYHLRNINLTYKDEWRNVQRIADALGVECVIESVSLHGKQEWIEHPLKNWIIADRALQYGLKNGCCNIAFGNFSSSTLDLDPFDVCGGDCKEMWNLYNNIVETVIKDFKMRTPLINMRDTLDILMRHKDVAVMCQSCIGPFRYRDYLHDKNCKKFGLELPEHRCFSCWKCCLEYIVYTDNDIYPYNEEMYIHCLDILKKTILNEQGLRIDRNDVWEHYFFYERGDSKYYG